MEAVAVAANMSAAPRRRRGVRAEPPSGAGGALGEHFTAPRPGKTDSGFGDWASAPDASCACVNCMIAANPGFSSECQAVPLRWEGPYPAAQGSL